VKVVTKICLTWKLLLLTILKLINRDFELTVLFSYVIILYHFDLGKLHRLLLKLISNMFEQTGCF
jgi:hypothetical protein